MFDIALIELAKDLIKLVKTKLVLEAELALEYKFLVVCTLINEVFELACTEELSLLFQLT